MDPVLREIFRKETAGHILVVREFIERCARSVAPHPITEALYRACHTLSGIAKTAGARQGIKVAEPMEHYVRKLHDNGHGLPAEGRRAACTTRCGCSRPSRSTSTRTAVFSGTRPPDRRLACTRSRARCGSRAAGLGGRAHAGGCLDAERGPGVAGPSGRCDAHRRELPPSGHDENTEPSLPSLTQDPCEAGRTPRTSPNSTSAARGRAGQPSSRQDRCVPEGAIASSRATPNPSSTPTSPRFSARKPPNCSSKAKPRSRVGVATARTAARSRN